MPVTDSKVNSKGSHLLSFISQYGLYVLNRRDCLGTPTHQSSVLDLALTNRPLSFSLSLDVFGVVSDHSPLTLTCNTVLPVPPTPPPRWSVGVVDWSYFTSVCEQDFSQIYDEVYRVVSCMTEDSAQSD